MNDPLTTVSLLLLTFTALGACVVAVRRVVLGKAGDAPPLERWLVIGCAAGAALLFVYRWLAVNAAWRPLEAHVDGLLLISAMLAAMVAFLQARPRLSGIGAFALPVLTLLLAWSICASAWTWHPFEIDSVWKLVHLTSVYMGTLFIVLAAVAGGLFLFVDRSLRQKKPLRALGRLASLEATEDLIVRMATLGFAVLTLGLVSGLVIVASESTRLGAGWWYSPKILLATASWAVYALVMNVRYTSRFRGARAAWLSIAGLVLLLATLSIANALPSSGGTGQAPTAATLPQGVAR